MEKLYMKKSLLVYRTKKVLRQHCVTISLCVSLLFIIFTVFGGSSVDDRQGYDLLNLSLEQGSTFASKYSVFKYVSSRIYENEKKPGRLMFLKKLFPFGNNGRDLHERSVLSNWDKASKADQCALLLQGFYLDPKWDNADILTEREEKEDYRNMQLAIERMRTYKYCFMDEDIDILDTFKAAGFSPNEAYVFQKKLFMFLKQTDGSTTEYLYPRIENLRTGVITEEPTTDLSVSEYNAKFIPTWRNMAKGKGIAVSVSPKEIRMLHSLFAVLNQQGNKLPIQILDKGETLTLADKELIKSYAVKTNQDVSVVDLSPIIDAEYADENIIGMHNKWFAAMFNTFEEVLLLDVDVIPFVGTEKFFQLEPYTSRHILFWRNRDIKKKNPKYCPEAAIFLEPTTEEHQVLKTDLHHKLFTKQVRNPATSEDKALSEFCFQRKSNHVDPGLIVFNKKLRFQTFAITELLHQHDTFRACVGTGADALILGAFAAGETFRLDPRDAGIVGSISYSEADKMNFVCGTQIAHNDDKDNLLWISGGGRTCKNPDLLVEDFAADEEYYEVRYGNYGNAETIYKSKIRIDGYLAPKVSQKEWVVIPDCGNTMRCAFVDPNVKDFSGRSIKYNDETKSRVTNLIDIWYNAE